MKTLWAAATGAAVFALHGVARADESIIRHYGDHAPYIFEAEPHGIVGYGQPFDRPGGAALGFGFRGSFRIADGFIRSINDSFGVGFGIDFAPDENRVLVPIVFQWNFWLSRRWSVFAEPGFAIISGPEPNNFDPFIFYTGARFHFTPRIALTLRAGYPDISVGVSFLL